MFYAIVRPETVLRWTRNLIKRFWTFRSRKKRGRPETPIDTKRLILQMKNDSLWWGIMQYAVTTNPTREFVRQDLIRFSERREGKAYLIHDRSPELCCLCYRDNGLIRG